MNNQTLSLYRIFYTVAESGNISRAARELYISQPAISKAIGKLEEELDTTLFLRNSRGVSMTPEGQLLYNHVRLAFRELQQGEAQLQKIRKLGIGQIRIGVSTTLCKFILIPYLKDFIATHPHISITIENQASAQTLEMLNRGTIDLGVIAKPDAPKGIHFKPVIDIQDTFVASPQYMKHLYDREGTTAAWFSTGTIMMLDKKNMTRNYLDQYLAENHIVLERVIELSTMDLLIEFAKIGVGIGACIRECVAQELERGELMEISLDVPIQKRTLGFATSASAAPTNAIQEFFRFVENHGPFAQLSS